MSTARTLMAIATDIWNVLPRRARWVTGTLLVLWLGWVWLFQERYGGASVIVMSVMDRPVSYASVNGKMGGKTAGPYSITGDTARIDWLLSTTGDQYDMQGLRPEKHTVTLPMPKREKGQDDFCILFLADNKPLIRWANSCSIDMNAVIKKYRTRG
ncbi:hypothetical protein [Siccibacter turicensis]|uniref:hypothetical protein n=1 Tax=Siccibacter turicensis TaxID=357233 RepID=UPI003F54E4FA